MQSRYLETDMKQTAAPSQLQPAWTSLGQFEVCITVLVSPREMEKGCRKCEERRESEIQPPTVGECMCRDRPLQREDLRAAA